MNNLFLGGNFKKVLFCNSHRFQEILQKKKF
jgi:hypothetical protein